MLAYCKQDGKQSQDGGAHGLLCTMERYGLVEMVKGNRNGRDEVSRGFPDGKDRVDVAVTGRLARVKSALYNLGDLEA